MPRASRDERKPTGQQRKLARANDIRIDYDKDSGVWDLRDLYTRQELGHYVPATGRGRAIPLPPGSYPLFGQLVSEIVRVRAARTK